MAETQASPHDYTTGTPRRHHNLYLKDGTFLMQVENAIFKIHGSVLVRYSPVIKDMLDAPNDNERPLILTGDSAAGWEFLLGLQYDSPRIKSESLSGEHLLLILPIAHKYCMERIEADIIEELKKTPNNDGFVDLVVASRIIDSDQLYRDGIQRLISSGSSPELEQSKRMGAEATHAVMTAIINKLHRTNAVAVAAVRAEMATALAGVNNTKCRFCQNLTGWKCSNMYCHKVQTIESK